MEIETGPGVGTWEETSKVRKKPLFLIRVFRRALASLLLLELIGKKFTIKEF